jgi:thymidylate synthase
MVQIEGSTYSSILKKATSLLFDRGREVAPRGMHTREMQGITMVLASPLHRYPRLEGRNANIFALIAETIWVMAGRNDLPFIQAYLPRMAAFSDDGERLSGGYGPRIRNWRGIDQLHAVVGTLRADPSSRRAVISLFDPLVDHDQAKKDIPCTNLLHFTTQGGRLHLNAFSRSMDIMWGSAINFFEWTTIQEAVARWLALPIGGYTHSVGSLHIYDEFIARARRFIAAPEPVALPITPFDVPLDKLDASCDEYFRVEALFRGGTLDVQPKAITSGWMAEAIEFSRAFWVATLVKDYRAAEAIIRGLPLSEGAAMALDQIAFMERAHAKAAGSRTSHA